MIEYKVCPVCVRKRPAEEFRSVEGKPHGYCDKCRREYMKTYNKARYTSPEARDAELARGRDKYKRVVLPMRIERKKKLIAMMGGKCVRCGYCKSAAGLDFDHIDPSLKRIAISPLLAVNQPWAWEQALEEAKKCRLLCSNCHREHTFPGWELSSTPPTPSSSPPPGPIPPACPHDGTVGIDESCPPSSPIPT